MTGLAVSREQLMSYIDSMVTQCTSDAAQDVVATDIQPKMTSPEEDSVTRIAGLTMRQIIWLKAYAGRMGVQIPGGNLQELMGSDSAQTEPPLQS